MAAPVIVACAKDAWTKVATNVVSGRVWRIKQTARYSMTYALTGAAAPTDLSTAVNIFNAHGEDSIPISSTSAIDVYIYCRGYAGSVRVDL